MKQFNSIYKNLRIALPLFLAVFLFAMAGCEKDMNDEDFNPDFSFEYLDDNTVKFNNLSTGEYYWLTWDFANNTSDTSVDKKKSYEKSYSKAGDYAVTLSVSNYVGKVKTVSKTVSISSSNIAVSFTAEIDTANPNMVRLTNTTQGQYDSFKWVYSNVEVEDEMEYLAYFPFAGDYDVQLVINIGENKFTDLQTVNIVNDIIEVSFTAEFNEVNLNKVHLTNTTEGQYDSFKWIYLDDEVENEIEHLAYFQLAGDYDVQLVVTYGDIDFYDSKIVIIAQDDIPDTNLIWAEEFDYTGLPDPAKWNMETGGGGWGNNELQYYTNSENNAKVENGMLTITAREEEYGGRDYTSARMTTQSKFDFKYGKIEARIKLPYGQGLWPAFWMLGANINSVSWPACGEIDIMEMVGGDGQDNTCHATLHWENADGDHGSYGESHTLSSGIFADDFHVFSVEWNSQMIKAYVDGINYYTISITEAQFDEFRENFFIILNLAVGGDWPGSPDASTLFPQTMQVDYVRVYQEP